MKTKYVRLLSYDNAMRLVNFVNENKEDYANITVGGVHLTIYTPKNWERTIKFLNDLGVRYELNDEPPHETSARIVKNLKEKFG